MYRNSNLSSCDTNKKVETILPESSKDSGNTIPQTPLELTIISNDVSLFTDTDSDSHQRAISRFWARVRVAFNNNIIRSVNIVVFETGVSGLELTNKNARNTAEVPTHQFKVAQCVRTIQKHVSMLSDKEYANNGGHLSRQGMPMNVEIEFLGFHPIMFQSLIRKWTTSIMSPVSGGGRIHFDLPETMDGTQCSVTLDLSYIILPHRVDSELTLGLVNDIKHLGTSFVEVVQLVPLCSVDLSFIYGVPMRAKAGLEGDLLQYKEMQILVQQLWKYLGSNDLALVLRSTNDVGTEFDRPKSFGYHNNHQLFLLIAEKVAEDTSHTNEETTGMTSSSSHPDASTAAQSSENGVLYRYVSQADCILQQSPQNSIALGAAKDDGSNCDDFNEQTQVYSDYLRRSLEFLDTAELNPFLTDNPYRSPNENKESELSPQVDEAQQNSDNRELSQIDANNDFALSYENTWIEDSGVGLQEIVAEKTTGEGEDDISSRFESFER